MRFDGAARHIELTGNFFVIAALQKQFGDLPFPRPELDLGVLHAASPFSSVLSRHFRLHFGSSLPLGPDGVRTHDQILLTAGARK